MRIGIGAIHRGIGVTAAQCAAAGEVLYSPPGASAPWCVIPHYVNPAYTVNPATGMTYGSTGSPPQYPSWYTPTSPSNDPTVFTTSAYTQGLNNNMWAACSEQLGLSLTQAQLDAAWATGDPGTYLTKLYPSLLNCNVGLALNPPPPEPVIPPVPVVQIPAPATLPTPAGGGVSQQQIQQATNPPTSGGGTTATSPTNLPAPPPSRGSTLGPFDFLWQTAFDGIPNFVWIAGGGLLLIGLLGRK